MRILEKGTKKLPETIEYVKKCHTCGCKFIYTKSDINYQYYSYDLYKVLDCPQCKHVNNVPLFKKRYKGDILNK